jgi:PAP2 superfamily
MLNRFLTPADKWRFGLIALTLLIFLIAWPFTTVTVEWASFGLLYFLAVFPAAIGLTYRALNRHEGIAAAFFVSGQMILFSNFAALDNYLGFASHRPLIDEFLAGLDRALGLDWWSYVTRVKSNFYFGRVLMFAYDTSIVQLIVAVQLLAMTHRFARLDRLTLAFMISGFVTIGFWVLFPSLGPVSLRHAQGLPDPTFALATSKNIALQLLALHAGPLPPLRADDLTGYIGFPSFHTVMAILTARALWGLPVSGQVALILNIFVFLSLPADGGHHFVDLVGGVVVALLSIALANMILRQSRTEPEYGLRARERVISLRFDRRFHEE